MGRDVATYNEYQRAYQLDRYHRRKREAIAFLGGECVECGSAEQLEIDHIDRALKSFNISNLWGIKEEKFYEELRKCQLLCHFHHTEKTRKENSVSHGEGLSGKRNCPCVPCKQRKAEYMAIYNRTRSRS